MRDTASEIDTVAQAATKALKLAGNDVSQAIKLMAERVRESQPLRQALLDPLIEYACGNAVRFALGQQRKRVWNTPSESPNGTPEQRAAALAVQNLLMFPLPGGQLLGAAKGPDLDAASEFYGKQAADMAHKQRWLKMIRTGLPDKKTVSQVFDEPKLRELQIKAAAHA